MSIFKKFNVSNSKKNGRSVKLGAFGGVFTPSILTIIGIIFYLRTGYVVGQVGITNTLVIISFCYTIALLTSLSLSALATSMEVKGGGFYYVISRTLGNEYGGALGLALFISISIGIAFYAVGLGEVVVRMNGVPEWLSSKLVAVSVILLLFVLAWAGADVATQMQYVVMAAVAASILLIGWGGITGFQAHNLSENSGQLFSTDGGSISFWTSFALFFPAITGFTQGLNMSGDLAKPTRSIPVGTFAAVGLSFLFYVGLAILLAGNAPTATLRNDYLVLEKIAPAAWVVSAGVIAATASSAMASFLGAPRIAQAVGRDNVFPMSDFFAEGSGSADNPRRAVALSGAIALSAAAVGDLNFLAPIITMFFLASYGLLNYATFFVAHAESPSFRPTFRAFNKYLSLAGALMCALAMLAIDLASAAIAILCLITVHQFLRYRGERKSWADSQRAYEFQRVREHLLSIDKIAEHDQDWRPQILVVSNKEDRRRQLLHFAQWIEARSGLTSLVSVIETQKSDNRDPADVERSLADSIGSSGVQAFAKVVTAPDFNSGLSMLLQAYGVGPLKANTILLNWVEHFPPRRREQSERRYARNLSVVIDNGCNVLILSAHPDAIDRTMKKTDGERPRIDIWWCGGETGDLMLILSYLMTRMRTWANAEICVMAEANKDRPERTRNTIELMLESVRIDAEVKLLDAISDDVVREQSHDAAMTYFPGILRNQQFSGQFDIDIDRIVDELRLVAFCIAGEDIVLAPDPDGTSSAEVENEAT